MDKSRSVIRTFAQIFVIVVSPFVHGVLCESNIHRKCTTKKIT